MPSKSAEISIKMSWSTRCVCTALVLCEINKTIVLCSKFSKFSLLPVCSQRSHKLGQNIVWVEGGQLETLPKTKELNKIVDTLTFATSYTIFFIVVEVLSFVLFV